MSLKWGMPVREILQRFSGDEITELQGLEYLEPWGYAIDNHRAAIGAYVAVCVNSEEGKSPSYGKFIEDWFGDRERDAPEKPQEDKVIDFVKAGVLATGGTIE